eukprot:10033961-Karenia_brevis.AAC.1
MQDNIEVFRRAGGEVGGRHGRLQSMLCRLLAECGDPQPMQSCITRRLGVYFPGESFGGIDFLELFDGLPSLGKHNS